MNGNGTQDDRYVECDECKNNVDCYKNSIHIVYKGECINPAEKKNFIYPMLSIYGGIFQK